jgi:hypothetical protein
MILSSKPAAPEGAMLIATMEGQSWCYEVIVQSDGFLVQVRDLDTGEVALDDTTLFRTAPAALAYADMVAAADRYAAAEEEDEVDEEIAETLERQRDRFAALRLSLSDDGIGGDLLIRRQETMDAALRRKLH